MSVIGGNPETARLKGTDDNLLDMSKSQAEKLYTEFTDAPVDAEFEGTIPQPTTLTALGPVIHIVYVSDKWHEREGRTNKKNRFIRYIHTWEKARPMMCIDEKNDFYHLVGKVDVRPEGITDYRGERPGNKGNNANYNIPADLAYLGGIEEITYESLEDGQEYRIDFEKKVVLCSNSRGDQLYLAKLKA
jgi:hypothetical protein